MVISARIVVIGLELRLALVALQRCLLLDHWCHLFLLTTGLLLLLVSFVIASWQVLVYVLHVGRQLDCSKHAHCFLHLIITCV